MTSNPDLSAAVAIFLAQGWADADLATLPALPVGGPSDQKAALSGLVSGDWPVFRDSTSGGFQAVNVAPVDLTRLGLFAIRVGVNAARAVQVLPSSRFTPDDITEAVIATRGAEFAQSLVDHCDEWHMALAMRLVHRFSLPIPMRADYLNHWADQAVFILSEPNPHVASGQYHPIASEKRQCNREVIVDRFAEHLTAWLGGSPVSHGDLPALGVKAGLIERDRAIALLLTAWDSAQRPIDRRTWYRGLRNSLQWSDTEAVDAAPLLVPLLALSDGEVVEDLGPALISAVSDELLPEVVTVCLSAQTKKALRAVIAAVAARPSVDPETIAAASPQLQQLTPDRSVGEQARKLLAEWSVESGPHQPTQLTAVWEPVPPLWQVPRFDVGDLTGAHLTDLASQLVQRAADTEDVELERFLALLVRVAHKDQETARSALVGIGESWLPGLALVPWWRDRGDNAYGTAHPGASTVLMDREWQIFTRLGELPCLLSEPSTEDLAIHPTDLVHRLKCYQDADIAANEADLYLALLRLSDEPAPDLDICLPVRRSDGTTLESDAGTLLAGYLADRLIDPGIELPDWQRSWSRRLVTIPQSLREFPDRFIGRYYNLPNIPTWGDSIWTKIAAGSHDRGMGLEMRQLARHATPLTPGAALAMLTVGRSLHHNAVADAALAVTEAWERGLLRPGVPDVRYLGWTEDPESLAATAEILASHAADGLLAVVWPVVDDLLTAAAGRTRLLPGAVQLVETIQFLLPAVKDAVTAGIAEPSALALPGLRSLAQRRGTSAAVRLARSVVASIGADLTGPPPDLPDATTMTSAEMEFSNRWPLDAGVGPTVVDDASFHAQWDDQTNALVRIDLTLPGQPGAVFRVVKRWFHDLAEEGRCDATLFRVDQPEEYVSLYWDGTRLAATSADWRAEHMPGHHTVPPLTSSLVAVLLVTTCQAGTVTSHYGLSGMIRQNTLAAGTVQQAMPLVLGTEPFSPLRLVGIMNKEPITLPVLWPVLTESLRFAVRAIETGESGKAGPSWLNRVLDATIAHGPSLRVATVRGLVSPDWSFLGRFNKSSRTVASKAETLRQIVTPAK